MPISQLLCCTLNPVNLLLFTLSRSSYSLRLYLSPSHTHMLVYSAFVSLARTPPRLPPLAPSISLQLPAVHLPLSRTRCSACSLSLPLSVTLFHTLTLSSSHKPSHPLSLYEFAASAESHSKGDDGGGKKKSLRLYPTTSQGSASVVASSRRVEEEKVIIIF